MTGRPNKSPFIALRVLSYLMIAYGAFWVSSILWSDGGVAYLLGEYTGMFMRQGMWVLGLGIVLGSVLMMRPQARHPFHFLVLAVALVPFVDGARQVYGGSMQHRAETKRQAELEKNSPAIVGVPISGAVEGWTELRLVRAGRNGFVAAWLDPDRRIHVQRVDSTASTSWTADGTNIGGRVSTPYARGDLAVVSDGFGGIILFWKDDGEGIGVRAQRVDAGGELVWGPDGIQPMPASEFAITSDGGGGVVVITRAASDDAESGAIRVQRLSALGNPVWPGQGVRVGSTGSPSGTLDIAADGQAGFVATYGRHAQHLDDNGVISWPPEGVAACDPARILYGRAVDGEGGVIVTRLCASDDSLYVQRVDARGTRVFDRDGVLLRTQNGAWLRSECTSDGDHGAIVWWSDSRGGYYAQRVDASGSLKWIVDGVPVCSDASLRQVIGDEVGGLIVVSAWGSNVLAQRFGNTGEPRWGSHGVRAAGRTMCALPTGEGGCYLVWVDSSQGRLVAQRVDANGVAQWISPSS